MAAPTFTHYRDMIMKNLAEVSKYVTEAELAAVMAEINREIMNELRLRESIKTGTVSYTLLAQSVALPADCIEVKRIMIPDGDAELWPDVVDYADTGTRNLYEKDGRLYAYCLGRTLYLSQTVESDTTITLYYIPFFSEAFVTFPTTEIALGSTQQYVPVIAGKAFRYGCLADLMIIHASTQLQEYKASRWQMHYEKLLGRLSKLNLDVMPVYQHVPRGQF